MAQSPAGSPYSALESVEKAPDKSIYVVQEYVLDLEGGNGYWATECELQVIRGGTAA